jgi:hypothetical protein
MDSYPSKNLSFTMLRCFQSVFDLLGAIGTDGAVLAVGESFFFVLSIPPCSPCALKTKSERRLTRYVADPMVENACEAVGMGGAAVGGVIAGGIMAAKVVRGDYNYLGIFRWPRFNQ